MTDLRAGGAETNLLALLKYFQHEKFEHAVAYGGGGPLLDEFAKAGVRFIKLSERPLTLKSIWELSSMLSIIGEYAPDIVHAHLDLPNIVGLAYKKKSGCKLILHLHGLGSIEHRKLPERPFKHRFWNLIARGYRYSDKIVAICSFQLASLAKWGVRSEQIVMVPNGITMNNERPVRTATKQGFRFINIGRFFPQKDHALLIRSFKEVCMVSPDARLLLVGDGPLRTEVEQQVKDLELVDNVEFLGVRRDVPELLGQSDCFVLGSRWELHPITILEAMRAGLPVIASDVGGIRDTLVDAKTGFLVNPGDQSALTSSMVRLVEDPDHAVEMGLQGYEVVRNKFSNELVARRFETIYCELVPPAGNVNNVA